jgi:pimeloyl-ACP methyl ester carboxylesterase
MNLTMPLTLSARLASFDLQIPQTPSDIVALSLLLTNPSLNATDTLLMGYYTSSPKEYNVSATLCQPETAGNGVLQILTHGIGFDKSYWDLPPPFANHSYVAAVVDAGYSTLAIDRLGIGGSSRGDPINEIQAALEVESLASITRLIRNGTFLSQKIILSNSISSLDHKKGWGPPFGMGGTQLAPDASSVPHHPWDFSNSKALQWGKIIHVGHSFGSALTLSLTAKYPSLSDGIVLTGFALTTAYLPLFAAGANFETQEETASKLDGEDSAVYPHGYLVSATTQGLTYLFLLPGFFNNSIAEWVQSHKQPVTPGELLTLGPLVSEAPSTFTGPVLIFTGSADLAFCGGACGLGLGSLVAQGRDAMWPNAKKVEAYVQPNTGHGLTMHWNATAGYAVINRWLKTQGFG